MTLAARSARDEEFALLKGCALSRSRSLVPFVTLAIETGVRYGVIRTLQWKSVDFENRCLRWGKDKTAAGTGRVVPLSQRAMAALNFWATHFPERTPEHYVFPAERYGAGGDQFSVKAYHVDPAKPIGSIKEAWEAAKLRAAKILKGTDDEEAKIKDAPQREPVKPLHCRFHDLRHTAVSRMLNAGVPDLALINVSRQKRSNLMEFSCEHFPKCANHVRHRSRSSQTLPARTAATI